MGATRRVTLKEAADILGVSKEAVRKRVIRDTLQSDKGADGRVYVYLDAGGDEAPTGESDALISQLRGENEFLRDQVRRQQEIIAQQAITMRQLSAPAEESAEAAETVEEAPERAEPRSDAPGPQTATQPPQGGGLRGWRRRILGW